MNIQIFTIANLLSNIATEIVVKGIMSGGYENIREKIKAKFISHLETFLSDWCFTDGFRTKKLRWTIYELRISLPADFLLRIIFAMEKWTKAHVEKLYEQKITESESMLVDFQGKQEHDYCNITHFF